MKTRLIDIDTGEEICEPRNFAWPLRSGERVTFSSSARRVPGASWVVIKAETVDDMHTAYMREDIDE